MSGLLLVLKRNFLVASVFYLATAIFFMGALPDSSLAYVVGPESVSEARGADLDTVQRVLEGKLVSERLTSMGLSKEEITKRLTHLTDAELHSFASQLKSLDPGGESVLGVVIGVLIIVILVMVIMKLSGHEIIID